MQRESLIRRHAALLYDPRSLRRFEIRGSSLIDCKVT